MAASVLLMVVAGSVLLPRQRPSELFEEARCRTGACGPGGTHYRARTTPLGMSDGQMARVQLASADGEPLWCRCGALRCCLPPSVRATLVDGTYLWWVTDRQANAQPGLRLRVAQRLRCG